MPKFFLRLRRRRSLEQDLEAELAFHREMAAAHGNPVSLGNTTVVEEQARELWRFRFIENLWRDVVYGARSLRRSPALVVAAVLSLGLGIGVNTAMFSLAVEFLFSQPSVSNPATVVSVQLGGNSHANKEAVEFVRASGLFQDVAGENAETFINWNDGSETRQIFSVQVTKNYFATLGIPIAYGRGIVSGDSDQVVVLSNRFWRSHLSGDPTVMGRALRLDGRAYTIVGILPRDFRSLAGFGFSSDVYVPRYLDDMRLAMYARLKPGTTIGQARAGLLTVARRMDQAMPGEFPYAQETQVTAAGGIDRFRKETGNAQMVTVALFFLMLLLVVGLVLLIACVNVASLLLARGSARRRELAIRLSLGSGRGRLFQQLLVEAGMLAVLGTACGLMLRQAMAAAIEHYQPPLPIPIHLHLGVDWRLTLYAILLATLSTMASGVLPAWRSIRHTIAPNLAREGRMRMQRGLVVAQLALSLVVLTAGILFLRNLWQSNAISPGFDVRHTLRADVNLPPAAYQDVQRKRAYVDQSLRALAALPGVESAAAARIIPFTDNTTFGSELKFTDTGRPVRVEFRWNAVSPDYFRAMSIPVVRGRTFLPDGRETAATPVVVNRTFVARYLGDRDPVGRSFFWGKNPTPCTIVGIVEGTKTLSIGEDAQAQLYEDLSKIDNDRSRVQFVVRSVTPPATQLQPVHAVLRRIEPNAGLEVETLYSSIGLAFLPSQVGAVLLGGIGLLGLLLATIGLYGVMVYSVGRRTREIGLRLALGASGRDVTLMVLGGAVRLILVGSTVGLLCSFFLMKPLAMFLVPGLRPADPLTFVAVAALLAMAGLAAAWGPARRAAAVDPMTSLRYE